MDFRLGAGHQRSQNTTIFPLNTGTSSPFRTLSWQTVTCPLNRTQEPTGCPPRGSANNSSRLRIREPLLTVTYFERYNGEIIWILEVVDKRRSRFRILTYDSPTPLLPSATATPMRSLVATGARSLIVLTNLRCLPSRRFEQN